MRNLLDPLRRAAERRKYREDRSARRGRRIGIANAILLLALPWLMATCLHAIALTQNTNN